jgi:tRNA A-37 threonylcarbamoyl transferase component Bud32
VGDRLAAWSRTTDTIQVFLHGGASVFIKRYHYPRWKNRLKGTFRGTFFGYSRVRAEFRALQTMRQLGIQGVRPVAYGERRSLHYVHNCFLISEAVPGATSLANYAMQHASDNHSPRSFRRHRKVLTVLAHQVRHMHERRFVHGDLFWRNVLIRALGEEGCEFYFLDAGLGRRIWRKNRSCRSIVDDLAELMAIAPLFCSRTDLARFAKTYLNQERLNPTSAAWMARVADRSMAYRKHEAMRLRLAEVFNLHVRDLEGLGNTDA